MELHRLSLIGLARPEHLAHLKFMFSICLPRIMLHFLCTQCLHPEQKIKLLPTPDRQPQKDIYHCLYICCDMLYHKCCSHVGCCVIQVPCRFKSCLLHVGDSRWWESLTMVLAGSKAKCLSLVNHTAKTIIIIIMSNMFIFWPLNMALVFFMFTYNPLEYSLNWLSKMLTCGKVLQLIQQYSRMQ